ncbi:hypothetical protein STEG23_011956, partial [Scotinomys teguina]
MRSYGRFQRAELVPPGEMTLDKSAAAGLVLPYLHLQGQFYCAAQPQVPVSSFVTNGKKIMKET